MLARAILDLAGAKKLDQRVSPPGLARSEPRTPWLRHLSFFGPLLILCVAGLLLSLPSRLSDISALRLLYASVVLLTIGYLGFSWCYVLGALASLGKRPLGIRLGPALGPPTGSARTAVLLPIFEENAIRVFAAAGIIADEVAREHVGAFDVDVLSDTRSSAGVASELRAAAQSIACRPGRQRVLYRLRADNAGRKAGNIAEWIGRWGGAYEFAVVIDADSLMTGAAVARLIGAMEANPNAGLIQAMCYPIGCRTLFARIQQFSARLYGPLFQRGVAFWQGPRGNYWGHNAIVRTGAFAASCGLPHLPGGPPAGGEIMSHDTVEAALLLRAGWDVWMLPDGVPAHHGGSWEETPTNWLDHLTRDRRWCRGNLQHVAVLGASGLRFASLYHLIRGLMHYLYVVPIVAWLVLFVTIDRGTDPGRDAALLALIGGLLIVPRSLAAASAWLRGPAARGGGRGLVTSFLQVVTILQFPVTILFHVIFLFKALSGRPIRWDPQARGDRALTLGQTTKTFFGPIAVGLLLAAVITLKSTAPGLWLACSLVLAIPTAVLTSRLDLGDIARRMKLFVTPEEIDPPPICRALAEAETELAAVQTSMALPPLPPECRLAMPIQALRG